jgi:hypothetical protein
MKRDAVLTLARAKSPTGGPQIRYDTFHITK